MTFLSLLLLLLVVGVRVRNVAAATATAASKTVVGGTVDRHLCLRPVTPRSQIIFQILQGLPKRGRRPGQMLSEMRRNDASTCWKIDYTKSASHKHILQSPTCASNHPVTAPDIFDLITSSETNSRSRSSAPPYSGDAQSKTTHDLKFKLVFRPESAASTVLLARKLGLRRPFLQISENLSKLLDTMSSTTNKTSIQIPDFLLEGQNCFSNENGEEDGVSFNRNTDPNSNFNIIPSLIPYQQSSSHRRDIFSVPGCVEPRSVSNSKVDFTGKWKPIVTKEFLKSYDVFLQACGESYWMRKLLVNAVSMQSHHIRQFDQGRRLELVDMHPMASWNRSLVTSGVNPHSHENVSYQEVVNELVDPQGDALQVVAYWCDDGTVHKSLLQSSKPHLKGASLESNRRLELLDTDNSSFNSILVAEAVFHPPSPDDGDSSKLRHASLVWKYELLESLD
jgi:hypothetical protein